MKIRNAFGFASKLAVIIPGAIALLGVWGCFVEPIRDCGLLNCDDPTGRGTAADRMACCPQSPKSDAGGTDGGTMLPDADPPKPQSCNHWLACPEGQMCNEQFTPECVPALCAGAPNVNDVWGRETGALGNPPCGCPNALCQDGQPAGRKGQEDANNCQGRHIRLWQPGDRGNSTSVDRQQKFCLPPGQF